MDYFDKYLEFQKEVAKATLKIVDQFQGADAERPNKRTSNIDIVFDVLQSASQPLHISEIIRMASQDHGVQLNRDSIVSALLKKVKAGHDVIRTAPNTFASAKEGP